MTLPTSNPLSLATELVTTLRHDGDDDGADGDDDGADGDGDDADGDDLLIMPIWAASKCLQRKMISLKKKKYICQSVCLSRKNDQFKTNLSVCHEKLSFSKEVPPQPPSTPQQAL